MNTWKVVNDGKTVKVVSRSDVGVEVGRGLTIQEDTLQIAEIVCKALNDAAVI